MIGKPRDYLSIKGIPKKKYDRKIPGGASLPLDCQPEENTEVEILTALKDLNIGEESKDFFTAIKDVKKSSFNQTIKARVVKKGTL